MKNQLFEDAKRSDTLSKELVSNLLESMEYSSISFINWTIEVLKILKTRIDRGDRITDEASQTVYDRKSFQEFVRKNFSSHIFSQVFTDPKKAEKAYFQPESCEGGYNLIMASSSKELTYEWISSMSERFSLVRMIATGIVYVKDIRNNSYMPFISENGKYCRYDKASGKLLEL